MSWYKKKILGDVGESICINHFKAIGYDVESTGIENSLQSFVRNKNIANGLAVTSQKIYDKNRYSPDLLISRVDTNNQLESFFIEVKYRKSINDMNLFELELFWQYRKVIWHDNIVNVFQNDSNLWKEDWNDIKNNESDLEKAESLINAAKNTNAQYQNLPLIFYVIVATPSQHDGYIYLNLPVFSGWHNIETSNIFNSTAPAFKMYLSTNSTFTNFKDAYDNEIKLALNELF